MLTLRKAFPILSIFMLLLMACADDGAVGPVGPVGPEGQIGPQGDPGQDGNANVRSFLYVVSQTDWVEDQTNLSLADTISVPELTADVIQTGTVSLFQTADNSSPTNTTWTAMPYTDNVLSHSYSYTQGQLILSITVTLQGTRPLAAAITNDFVYKLVIIPSAGRIDGVDHTNWEELQMVYGLDDQEPLRQ